MADSSKLLLIGGGVAAIAWWQGWLAPLGIPAPSFASASAAPATTTPPATPPAAGAPPATTTPPAKTNYPSLAAIKTKMLILSSADHAAGQANCGTQPPATIQFPGLAPGQNLTIPNPAQVQWLTCMGTGQPMMGPDDWNTYLVKAGGPNPAPDPGPLFADRSQAITLDQYWSVMVPALTLQGLVGLAGYIKAGWR